MLLIALPAFAIINSNSYDSGKASVSEKCSAEIEGLKMCVDTSKITVKSGEPIIVGLSWTNSSEIARFIMLASRYSITIKDEKGKKLNTVTQQKILDGTYEPPKEIKVIAGSLRGLYIEPHQTETDHLPLKGRDYDLTAKGIYKLSISKTAGSLEEGKTIEFVIEDIEIKVK